MRTARSLWPTDATGVFYLDKDAPDATVRFRLTKTGEHAAFEEGADLRGPDGERWVLRLHRTLQQGVVAKLPGITQDPRFAREEEMQPHTQDAPDATSTTHSPSTSSTQSTSFLPTPATQLDISGLSPAFLQMPQHERHHNAIRLLFYLPNPKLSRRKPLPTSGSPDPSSTSDSPPSAVPFRMPFPAGTVGHLYYHAHPEAPVSASGIRFRVVPDGKKWEEGWDSDSAMGLGESGAVGGESSVGDGDAVGGGDAVGEGDAFGEEGKIARTQQSAEGHTPLVPWELTLAHAASSPGPWGQLVADGHLCWKAEDTASDLNELADSAIPPLASLSDSSTTASGKALVKFEIADDGRSADGGPSRPVVLALRVLREIEPVVVPGVWEPTASDSTRLEGQIIWRVPLDGPIPEATSLNMPRTVHVNAIFECARSAYFAQGLATKKTKRQPGRPRGTWKTWTSYETTPLLAHRIADWVDPKSGLVHNVQEPVETDVDFLSCPQVFPRGPALHTQRATNRAGHGHLPLTRVDPLGLGLTAVSLVGRRRARGAVARLRRKTRAATLREIATSEKALEHGRASSVLSNDGAAANGQKAQTQGAGSEGREGVTRTRAGRLAAWARVLAEYRARREQQEREKEERRNERKRRREEKLERRRLRQQKQRKKDLLKLKQAEEREARKQVHQEQARSAIAQRTRALDIQRLHLMRASQWLGRAGAYLDEAEADASGDAGMSPADIAHPLQASPPPRH
ncbi:hypothetical protein FB107DRAFT_280280 [Schizophyllum commune]